jgi:multidrug efflux pump
MIGVTVFGLILTPLFYYLLAKRGNKTPAHTDLEQRHV